LNITRIQSLRIIEGKKKQKLFHYEKLLDYCGVAQSKRRITKVTPNFRNAA